MRVPIIAMVACLCAGCVSRVVVPPVEARAGPAEAKAGRYVAAVSTADASLNAKSGGMVCGEWTFDVDLKSQFASSIRALLERSLETVEFVDRPIPSERIQSSGYRAQITVRQVDARADFSASERLLFRDARARVSISAIMTIEDEQGLAFQASMTGKGVRDRQVFGCASIGDAVGDSAHDALQGLVDAAAVHLATGTRRVMRARASQ